jgi:hypothetical protein
LLLLLLLLSQLFSLATLLLLLLLLLVLLLISGNNDDRSCRMVERDRFKEATTSLPPSWEDLRRGFVVADNNEDGGKTGTSGGEDMIPSSSSVTLLQFSPGGGIGHFPLSPGDGGTGHFLKSLKAKWFGLEGGLTRTPCCWW